MEVKVRREQVVQIGKQNRSNCSAIARSKISRLQYARSVVKVDFVRCVEQCRVGRDTVTMVK